MLSILEVCQLTGKSEKTIYRMMNSGTLRFTQKDGKRFVDKEDVLPFLPHSNVKEIEKKDALEQKVATLTNEVIRLSGLIEYLIEEQRKPTKDVKESSLEEQKSLEKRHKLSSNEVRAQKAKNLLFVALDELKANDNIPLYRGNPSITGIHRLTGIDRGTISKYLQEWIIKNF